MIAATRMGDAVSTALVDAFDNPQAVNDIKTFAQQFGIKKYTFKQVYATGTKPLGNAVDGFNLRFGPGGNTILGNVISANKRAGIVVESSESNNVVQGNFIGTDVTGTLTLGNADRGIVITDANHTTIQGNIIAHNALDGIGVRDNVSTSNQLLGNSIFGNATRNNPKAVIHSTTGLSWTSFQGLVRNL
jgi:parallel beta-helix repeat protein